MSKWWKAEAYDELTQLVEEEQRVCDSSNAFLKTILIYFEVVFLKKV